MKSDARRHVVGKGPVGRTNENLKVRMRRRTKKFPSAGLDLVPADAVEPSVLVGATAEWENERRRQAMTVFALTRRLQSCDQIHSPSSR